MWLVFLDQPHSVALWDVEWGAEVEWLDESLLEVWLRAKGVYDSIREDT
jgi:hypothetical protein